MKLILPFLLLLTACNNPKSYKTPKYCDLAKESNIWAEYEDTSQGCLVKGGKLDAIKNRYQTIADAINKEYADPSIKIDRKVNDTLYVTINNSTKLTQRMGSTGAIDFEASVVYSLTEGDSVTCVYLNFEEGDHGGSPGFFSRNSFGDNLLVKECKD